MVYWWWNWNECCHSEGIDWIVMTDLWVFYWNGENFWSEWWRTHTSRDWQTTTFWNVNVSGVQMQLLKTIYQISIAAHSLVINLYLYKRQIEKIDLTIIKRSFENKINRLQKHNNVVIYSKTYVFNKRIFRFGLQL